MYYFITVQILIRI